MKEKRASNIDKTGEEAIEEGAQNPKTNQPTNQTTWKLQSEHRSLCIYKGKTYLCYCNVLLACNY